MQIHALMNDTEATLLTRAYENPSTSLSLIWGTGVNAAMMLPVATVAEKLKGRAAEWSEGAQMVLVNTEASMLGAGVLPLSQVDRELDAESDHPGFQPLEQMTGGRYLGEITRRFMLAGAQNGVIFDGAVPQSLQSLYELEAEGFTELEK